MGKRKKAAKKPGPAKKKEVLSTTFQCLFCNHENSISVKLDKKAAIGNLSCKVCGVSFQCNINALSAPVDVYYDWVDACDAVAEGEAGAAGGKAYREPGSLSRGQPAGGRRGEDPDDFIDDDGVDAEGDYADDD
ncbi:putative zinc finger protein [Neofusicoccum parvum]|uniref:Transcription elongation factor 1 homolog n=3 Tax=Neofusicoccum TaxID=407951 RepID=R1GKI1_BOTPV|nr:putative transcription elongation factor protein [Neofusicoccum parvum UCRNP2]GME42430.1 putative zinc finger protein [Neofusicoccum parvum]GME46177.1 putative zinc finger protein [Neofusicoccum parvum]